VKYLFITLIVFGVNLLPAFGPPTWTLLVIARWDWHLNPVALVLLGVVAAGAGRFALAHGARRLRSRFSERSRANLTTAEHRLVGRRSTLFVLIGLFVISPLPSAQLFCAAGLLKFRILPLTGAFMAGRVVTYSLYLAAATAADHKFGQTLRQFWGSPWSIVLQLVLLVALAALPLAPWRRHVENTPA
jgi:membrane protein YqaA with SNARE-associated domain